MGFTMRETVTIFGRIFTLVISCRALGWSADPPILAEIPRALVSPYRTDDQDLSGFKLNLDIRVTNRTERPVDLPKSRREGGRTTRVVVMGVQAKQPDGSWSYIVQSSWYGSATDKFESCAVLKPGGVAEYKNVKSGLLLLKTQVAKLGHEPTMRFDLMTFCRQPDGSVLTKNVRTHEFKLRLNAPR